MNGSFEEGNVKNPVGNFEHRAAIVLYFLIVFSARAAMSVR